MLYDLEFQTAAYAAITAALTGASNNTPVTAHPNPNQALPYILIGESETQDYPAGHRITFLVHVYTKEEGPHTAKQLQNIVHSALHGQVLTAGAVCFSSIRQEFGTVNIDPDDEVWHGVQRFTLTAST